MAAVLVLIRGWVFGVWVLILHGLHEWKSIVHEREYIAAMLASIRGRTCFAGREQDYNLSTLAEVLNPNPQIPNPEPSRHLFKTGDSPVCRRGH